MNTGRHLNSDLQKINLEYVTNIPYLYLFERASGVLQKQAQEKTQSEETKDDGKLKFILEPKGKKYLEHVNKIKNKKWVELDFKDKEFVLDMYKAYRLSEETGITVQQLGTALMLYHANDLFFNKDKDRAVIQQYDLLDPKGPYNIFDIEYANRQEIAGNLLGGIAKLPRSEAVYFAIDLTPSQTAAFLYTMLSKRGVKEGFLPRFKEIFINFLHMQKLDSTTESGLLKIIKSLSGDVEAVECTGCSATLCKEKLTRYLHANFHITTRDMENIRFWCVGINLDVKTPNFAVSKNYDPTNSTTTFMSVIVTSFQAFELFLKAYHGKDAFLPLYTAGKFTPLYMRKADEGTLSYFPGKQYRPVELFHPQLQATLTHHDIEVHPFMATWHDLFFHLMKNSANPVKQFVRNMRVYIGSEKQLQINKMIWTLIDMDYLESTHFRVSASTENINNTFVRIFHSLVEPESDEFLENMDKYLYFKRPLEQDNLLIIAILALHNDTWKKEYSVDIANVLINKYKYFREFLNIPDTIREMQKMVAYDKQRNISASPTYYVLRYLLRNISKSADLCNEIYSTDILTWERNGGLQISKKYTENLKDFSLAKLSDKQIVTALQTALTKYNEVNYIDIDVNTNNKPQEPESKKTFYRKDAKEHPGRYSIFLPHLAKVMQHHPNILDEKSENISKNAM